MQNGLASWDTRQEEVLNFSLRQTMSSCLSRRLYKFLKLKPPLTLFFVAYEHEMEKDIHPKSVHVWIKSWYLWLWSWIRTSWMGHVVVVQVGVAPRCHTNEVHDARLALCTYAERVFETLFWCWTLVQGYQLQTSRLGFRVSDNC